MGWGSFLKSTLRLGGRMTSATAHTVGSAVLHPQQTLKGVGSATKSAVVGGSLGYIGWEKLTTDKSVVGIVSDAVIGEDTTKKIGDTVSGIGDGVKYTRLSDVWAEIDYGARSEVDKPTIVQRCKERWRRNARH